MKCPICEREMESLGPDGSDHCRSCKFWDARGKVPKEKLAFPDKPIVWVNKYLTPEEFERLLKMRAFE